MNTRDAETLVTQMAATAVMTLGGVIMIAWWAKWDTALQVFPGFVPMQFNTALSFLLTGMGIFLALERKKRAGIICTAFVAVFSGLIGLQYIAGINIGIDTLFIEPHIQNRTSHTGRMAPNTALCFVILSLTLLYWHLGKKAELRLNITVLGGLTVTMLSFIALFGYLIKVEAAYSWWGLSDMAVHTAAGLFLSGIGTLSLTHPVHSQAEGGGMHLWTPTYAAIGGLVVTLLLAQTILTHDKRATEDILTREAKRVAGLTALSLEKDMAALHRMQSRLSTGDTANLAFWRKDAANYTHDNKAYHALALADRNKDVYAEILSDPADSGFWNKMHLESLKETDLVPGPSGLEDHPHIILISLPLLRNGVNDGFLLVAYDIGRTVAEVLPRHKSPFRYALAEGGHAPLFSSSSSVLDTPWGMNQDENISLLGRQWTLRTMIDTSSGESNGLALLVFLSGILLSLLLSHALHQGGKARRYQKQLETLLETMVDGFITIDARGTILSYNKACERIFGYKSSETIGKGLVMLMPRAHAEKHDTYIRNYMDTGVGKIIGIGRELEGRRKNGSLFPLDLSVAEVRSGGQRIFSGLIRDISARKAAEEELMRSHVELEQFAYVASHDLKAPLRGIDNLARWLAEDLAGVITSDAREKIDLMRSRVTRLERLLEDILTYSRAGRIVGAPETVEVGPMLQVIAEPLTADGRFKVNVKGAMPVFTTARTPLEQVFSNLIGNAVKHHDRGRGEVTVEAEEVEGFYEFSVSDDGPGIPPEFHERVFQMFQTLQPRDRREGSGLGMAIVKKLVEWQGGKVWIMPGEAGERGTTVRFLWPKNASARMENAA